MSSLTIKDLEKLQAEYPDYRMELVDGNIIVMSLSGYESGEVISEFTTQLLNWVKPRKLGRVNGSNAGFILPNSDIRNPDVSFVLAERLRKSPLRFAELSPDLIVQVKSFNNTLNFLRKKIEDFLGLGTRIGILINPEKHIVAVYRLGQDVVILGDGDVLTIPDLLPGWELIISDLWSPEFE